MYTNNVSFIIIRRDSILGHKCTSFRSYLVPTSIRLIYSVESVKFCGPSTSAVYRLLPVYILPSNRRLTLYYTQYTSTSSIIRLSINMSHARTLYTIYYSNVWIILMDKCSITIVSVNPMCPIIIMYHKRIL